MQKYNVYCGVCFKVGNSKCLECNMRMCAKCLKFGIKLGVCSPMSYTHYFYCSISCLMKKQFNQYNGYLLCKIFLRTYDSGGKKYFSDFYIEMQERLYSSCIRLKLIKELSEHIEVNELCKEICSWF